MDSWINQKGYPVLSVSSRQDGQDQVVSLTQNKFTADSSVMTREEEDALWIIPVTIVSQSKPNKVVQLLMRTRSHEVRLSNVSADEWIKVNHESSGFYRLQYTASMQQQLLKAVQNKELSPIDRATFLDDLLQQAKRSDDMPSILVSVLDYYVNEDSYAAWSSITACLSSMLQRSRGETRQEIHKWARMFLGPVYQKLGWHSVPGERLSDTLIRLMVLRLMTSLDDDDVMRESEQRFDMIMMQLASDSNFADDPDILSIVLVNVAKRASAERFKQLMHLFGETRDHELWPVIVSSLSSLKDESMIREALSVAMQQTLLPMQVMQVMDVLNTAAAGRPVVSNDYASSDIHSSTLSSCAMVIQVWNYFKDHVGMFHKMFSNTMLINGFVSNASSC